MCKPIVTEIPSKNNGPCGFSIRSHGDACAAFWLGETWRTKLANVLRRWADKAEGVQSFTVVGNAPSQIAFTDVLDASAIGFNGASEYLNDLWRDRVFGSKDTKARPVRPNQTVL